jgi:large subunit ribosomal protein L9
VARLLTGTVVTLAQKVGENDQLFGSVTAQNIADALEKQNFHVDRRKIHLEEPIRTLGEHKISVRLHREVNAEITVNVTKED